ncbi:MAG TPA: hypothetical protein VIL46_11280, partial [Gemmataceae bacterium]
MSSPMLSPRFGLGLAVLAGLLAGLTTVGCKPPAGAEAPPAPALPPPEEEAPAGPPLFADVTAASGISFTYRNGEDTADHLSILESLGGGVGLIDYDRDGLLDVFLPAGGGFEGPDQKTIVGYPCKLYR